MHQAYTFLHLETTGLNPEYGDTITEIAAIKYTSLVNKDFQRLRILIENEKTELSPAMSKLVNFLEDSTMVCFYSEFHTNFLSHASSKTGIDIPNPSLCAYQYAKSKWRKTPSYRLDDLTASVQVPESLEGALNKCFRTMVVFVAAIQ